ncbi:Hypothetical protein SCF082_LOCUS19352 [Durusdinium trenchii]|uniref:HEAT repeat domain-containing protein n=1 Tax=Durusdinium trenchii TaxID=1381693 RepID=A0ABP0KVN8_9DINO
MRTTDPQAKVRRAAIQALGRIGPAGAVEIPAFFRDQDDGIRHFAAETLGAAGDEAAAAVCAEQLKTAGPDVKRSALLALGRMKLVAWAPQVAGCLHDSDLATRLAAIQALSDLKAEEHAEELEALAVDGNKGVRQAAVAALAKMGSSGARWATSFLEDEDPAVRQSAVRVYSPLHSKLKASLAKPYAEMVARRLLDEDWRVRLAAVVALGDLDAQSYVEQLGALKGDPDNQVRRSVRGPRFPQEEDWTTVDAANMEEASWVESLGFLKDFEVRRRAAFGEWLEGFKARLATERRKATSSQLLVAQVKAQIRERAELDEDVSKRISKFAARELSRTEDWCTEDRADADFLSSVQLECAKQLAEASSSFRVLLENSENFKDMETLSRDGFKTIALAEQTVRDAEAKHTDCIAAWGKHESLCRQQLGSRDLTGLWKSEASYRKSVAKFADAADAAHQKAAGLARQLREEAERFRALTKSVLSDVAACTAASYNTLARTANEASPYRQQAMETRVPSIPHWQRPVPPASALTLRECPAERQAGLLRHWQSCHLLLTKEGSVHCYDGADTARTSPVWSGRPSHEGGSLSVDPAAQTLTLYPAREWLKQRWSLTVRLPSEELCEWEKLLAAWWPSGDPEEPPVDAQHFSDSLPPAESPTADPELPDPTEPTEPELPGEGGEGVNEAPEATPSEQEGHPFT